jgi:hypothetical protein
MNEDTYAVGMTKGYPLKVRLRKRVALLVACFVIVLEHLEFV